MPRLIDTSFAKKRKDYVVFFFCDTEVLLVGEKGGTMGRQVTSWINEHFDSS